MAARDRGPDAGELVSGSDDTLILLFMCCHPALSPTSQIALTLRAVGGLTTAEIARGFLVSEEAMTRRITRAKQTVEDSHLPFRLPSAEERPERLRIVMHTLYLIFNEGYAATSGTDLQRVELSTEAIRLSKILHRLLPNDPEVTGLLALMLLTDARRLGRSGPGSLIPMADQDRALWDAALVTEGVELIEEAMSRRDVGPYQLQAAIAALHDDAPDYESTDWPQILGLYELLLRLGENLVVRLNHAVAVATVHGPRAGLDLLARLQTDARFAGDHRLHAVRAHMLEMTGELQEARANYVAAAERTTNLSQKRYLLVQAARLGTD